MFDPMVLFACGLMTILLSGFLAAIDD